MGFEFDDDTALARVRPGRYAGAVTNRWTVGGGPNGGYLASLVLRGVLEESPLPDPLTMTVHYPARPEIGPAEVVVEALRVGRGHAFFRAGLVQAGETRCSALVTTGRLRASGPDDFEPAPPAVPPPESCLAVPRVGERPVLWERLETRIASAEDLFFLREEAGEATTGGWTRFADGRPIDALSVPLLLDCWPPAVFSRTMQADPLGAPTFELTVHWRQAVDPMWCYGRFETRKLSGGYVDEDGELWDRSGALVAESRQLARYLGGGGGPSAALFGGRPVARDRR